MIHKICYWWYTDIRAGGPSGYLANLEAGLLSLSPNSQAGPDICLLSEPKKEGQTNSMEITAESLENHLRWFSNIDAIALQQYQIDRALQDNPRSIHCHTITDCLMTVQSLKNCKSNIPILFSCHSPEAFSKEFSDLWRDQGHDVTKIADLRAAVQAVEMRAFQNSDVWIFPCAEALDGYDETLPGFSSLRRSKDIRFVRSGVVAPKCTNRREATREKLGLGQSKIVLYIGRHNLSKGYDVLSAAAIKLLERNRDVVVLVAGRPGPLAPPIHPRFIELGWHPDPGELMQAADVFVLPNQTTYYDLVLLEALSFGLPVVASATGGNKEVSLISHGSIAMFNRGNIDAFVAEIELVLHDDSRRRLMSWGSRDTYERFHKAQTFAINYRSLVEKIWRDYDLYS